MAKSVPRKNMISLIEDGLIVVDDFVFDKPEIREFLERCAIPDRPAKLIAATQVGAICFERAATARDLDFVRQHAQMIADQVGRLPTQLQQEMLKFLGNKDGQLVTAIRQIIEVSDKAVKERVDEVKLLLDKEIDPRRQDTTLGKALIGIRTMLDPKQTDSIQQVLEKTVQSITADGGKLTTVMNNVLAKELKPLRDEIDRLREQLTRRDAAQQALAGTIAKGTAFEDEVLPLVQRWAAMVGASADPVGKDHKPGDILVLVTDASLPANPLGIVIEARDDAAGMGKKRIADDLAVAMKQRSAHYGIYLAKTQAALAQEIGDWSLGTCSQGPFVACTAQHLTLALRHTLLDAHYRAAVSSHREVDAEALRQQLGRINTALGRLRTIKSKATDIEKNADAVRREADALHREIADACRTAEDLLRDASNGIPTPLRAGRNGKEARNGARTSVR